MQVRSPGISLFLFLSLFLLLSAAASLGAQDGAAVFLGAQDEAGSLGGAVGEIAADEPVQRHPEGDAAISRILSPFCPGLMLEVCPSPPAKLLRDTIQKMAWAGRSADSIVAWMLDTYGDEYRAVPLTRGAGLWAWVMPPLALTTGLLVLMGVLRHFKVRHETAPAQPSPLSQEEEEALAAAMEELKATEEVPF